MPSVVYQMSDNTMFRRLSGCLDTFLSSHDVDLSALGNFLMRALGPGAKRFSKLGLCKVFLVPPRVHKRHTRQLTMPLYAFGRTTSGGLPPGYLEEVVE